MNNSGMTNFALGWTCIAIGLSMGLIIGLWAFDGPATPPEALAAYDGTPRRLLRLSHIAWIALGLFNVVLAGVARQRRVPRLALTCMNLGSTLLPLTLLVAVWIPPAKYLMALPASCVLLTTILMARLGWGALAANQPEPQQT